MGDRRTPPPGRIDALRKLEVLHAQPLRFHLLAHRGAEREAVALEAPEAEEGPRKMVPGLGEIDGQVSVGVIEDGAVTDGAEQRAWEETSARHRQGGESQKLAAW